MGNISKPRSGSVLFEAIILYDTCVNISESLDVFFLNKNCALYITNVNDDELVFFLFFCFFFFFCISTLTVSYLSSWNLSHLDYTIKATVISR